KYGLYISGVGAIITIVLNILFIPLWGFVASACISLAVYLIMMSMSYFWGQKHYPIRYDVKKDLLYIVIASVVVFISFIIFKRYIIIGNFLFILFAAFVIIKEQNYITALLN